MNISHSNLSGLLKLSLSVFLLFLSCHKPCPDCPSCPGCGDVETKFELAIDNSNDFPIDVFVFDASGNKTKGFREIDGSVRSTLNPGEADTTKLILSGQSLYLRVPIFGGAVHPGLNMEFDHFLNSQYFQFYIKNDSLHYVLKIESATKIFSTHVLGHACEPKPNEPPGQC